MKYLIKVSPVTEQIPIVREAYMQLLGTENRLKVHDLVNNGGILIDNLSKSEASRIASDLMGLFVPYEVIEMESFDPRDDSGNANPTYEVKLVDSGGAKLAVVKAVAENTEFGLKESKELVDNLGVIGVYPKEEAERVANILREAGAEVEINQIGGVEPEPEPEPVPSPQPQPEPGSSPHSKDVNIVFGKVTDSNKRPLQHLEIEIYDVDMRHWYPLANTLTDQDGMYNLEWTQEQLDEREYKTADIAVRVFTVERGSLLFETTMDDVRFNASEREEINITIRKPLPKEEIEFDLLVRKVKFLAGSVDIAELQEDQEYRDVTFLSRELDVAAEKIEYIIVAHRMEKTADINAAFFYALFRTDVLLTHDFSKRLHSRFDIGINSDNQTLLYDAALADAENIESAIKKAVEDNIVAASEIENISRNLNMLSKLRKEASDYYKHDHKKKVINRFSSFFENDKLGEIKELFTAGMDDPDSFIDKISDPSFFNSEEKEAEAKTNIELGKLFGFGEEVIPKIARSKGINRPEDIRKLAKLNKSEWEAEIAKINPTLKNKQLRSSYASAIVRKMENEFPTLAFTAQLERSEETVFENQEALVSFFNTHEDFDLQRHNVDLYLKEKRAAKKDQAAISEELKSVQRVFKLVPNYSKTLALLDENIHSSHSIVSIGVSRFTKEVAPKAGISENEAREIFRKAEAKHTAAMIMSGNLQDSASAQDIAALENSGLKKKLKAVGEDFPNLKSLFKITDTCACKHCRSVYSPAAYLVEILQFLDKRAVVKDNAASVLFSRRPGLGEIDLSCANANTPVPYIDLVCEILEEAISPDQGIDFHGKLYSEESDKQRIVTDELIEALTAAGLPVTENAQIFGTESVPGASGNGISSIVPPYYLRDEKVVCKITKEAEGHYKVFRLHQTLSSAEELAAAPEYVNEAAYHELRNKVFAFKLPFDLQHTEAKAYLSRFDVDRAELMRAFQDTTVPSNESIIAAEKLGLTDGERKLITLTPSPNNTGAQQAFWNAPSQWDETDASGDVVVISGSVLDYLKRVDHFLHRTDLTYKELDLLLKLKFIDKNGNLFISHHDLSCDTEQKEIANLDLDALDRIHRFLKLQKKTGWTFDVLDEMISQSNLGGGHLDDDCLIKAAQIKSISEKTKINIEELIGFFGEIPHSALQEDGPIPLYRQVFLNKAKIGIVEEALSPENVDGTEQLTVYADYIATCLHLKKNELDIIIGLLPDGNVTFSNLSYLLAASRLIKNLRLSAGKFSLLVELSELDLSKPEGLLEFIRIHEIFQLSPLPVEDVKFLLKHEASNLEDRVISDSKIEEILEELKAGYEKINEGHQSPFDENLLVEEQLEPFTSMLDSLADIGEADIKTFIKFFEGDWSDVSNVDGAKAFVDAKLPHIIKTDDIHTALEGLDAVEPEVDNQVEQIALLQAFMDAVAAFQINKGKQELLKQTLADHFKTEQTLVGQLLQFAKLKQIAPDSELIADLLSVDFDDTITPAEYPKQYASLRLMRKMFLLLNAFGFHELELEWYFVNNENHNLNWLEFDAIPYDTGQNSVAFDKFLTFIRLVHISHTYTAVENPQDTENPVDFFTVAGIISKGDVADRNRFLELLSLLTGHDRDTLSAIDAHLSVSFDINKYADPDNWNGMLECAEFARKLGASVEQIAGYVQPVLSPSEVNDLRIALKTKYDEDAWMRTLKEIMDVIRPQKRDVLAAFLLATHPEMKDENDLYDYFLVDVEMESCMPSSRIVQAHHSVQLFVQRCMMGLEPDAIADLDRDFNWNQWKWMKNYRVWEANRKVFLYPENWYDVTLSDDKSYLLDELISEIQQNELTNDTAESALRKYLEKLDTLAFLEVMATWYDVPNRTMHVFARTKGGDPATYYYRKFEKERYWTPWEKVELDITGDHLLAFMRNNRLHLAWPVFTEEPDSEQQIKVPSAADQGRYIEQDKPKKKLKVQLAISEFSNHKWQPKKISRDGIKTPVGWFKGDPKELKEQCILKYISLSEGIPTGNSFSFPDQIWLLNRHEKGNLLVLGIFDIAGCKGYPEILNFDSIVPVKSPVNYLIVNYLIPLLNNAISLPQIFNTEIINQKYVEGYAGNGLFVRNTPSILNSSSNFHGLLYNTPETFRITHPQQLTIFDLISAVVLGVMNSSGNGRAVSFGHNLNIPFGTLLPYFKEDNDHAYVIIPGFYRKGIPRLVEAFTDSEKRTASNVYQLIDDIINWYKKFQLDLENTPSPPEGPTEIIDFILKNSDFQKLLNELGTYANLDVFTNLLIGMSEDSEVADLLEGMTKEKPLVYGEQFKNMYHPMVCALRSRLYKGGIPALMKRETQLLESNFNFQTHYVPNPQTVPLNGIKREDGSSAFSYPVEDIDFESDGSYSSYNWDLFYRIPLHIATTLTKNQRFEEAMDWFHYMFNPTGALSGEGVQKYWVTKPFYLNQEADYINQRIDSVMYKTANMSNPALTELEFAVSEWRNKPFRPDVIARFRPVAYQKALLMKYIDNLTEWGDYLFRQDTMESIAQATQMYVLADKLLGPKPRTVPSPVKQSYETYNQLKGKIDSFGNALIELENILPDFSTLPESGDELPAPPVTLSMLYFCVPPNEKMFEYWDRIADRLFKIRHCQNIDGIERNLALFAPPIDPGMLVRAAASGQDLSAILAGFNAPLPYYRFNVLSQKATELANEVRTLGNALLQAMEKKDAEALALLRSDLELNVLNAVTDSKKLHVSEAKEQIEVLNRTKTVTLERHKYYSSIRKISSKEHLNLDKLEVAHNFQLGSQISQTLAGAFALVPDSVIGAAGFGGSPTATLKWGGFNLSSAARSAADVFNIFSSIASYEANRASILGGYERRFDDWKLQERLAERELKSIDKQIEAAEIRKEIAEKDLDTHELQIENAKKTDEFMRSKFTNQELYDWMIGEISSVYFRSYQLTHDFAKKAERCYGFELGNSDSFINYGYWDSMKKGLQSADKLIHDIKRMETGYLDKNKREYEITKHVSLAQLDPLALVRLRASGICDFEIPEVLYDMDHPGQYFRRLKSVSVSIPCIAGPYTSISAKLSLVNNRYRKNTNDPASYAEDIVAGDNRFVYNIGSIQSIATSSAQNDSGVFELNFRDDRYLPFENTGAISSWRLELPTEIKQFDYNTISDVIVHVKYTAKEGGSGLKTKANTALKNQLEVIKQGLDQNGLHIAINLKHGLPKEWHLLKNNGSIDLTLDKIRLPYMVQTFDTVGIESVMFVAKIKDSPPTFIINVDGNPINLARVDELRLCKGINSDIDLDTLFTLSVSDTDKVELEELLLIVKYRF